MPSTGCQVTLPMIDAPQQHRGTIMIVEDDEDSRFMMKTLLGIKGYAVVEASNGREAISAAEERCPDLILMDLTLPVMDGLAATEHIRASAGLSHLPIIVVSGHAAASHRAAAYAAGCTSYLTKPIDFDLLDNLLDTLSH